MTPGKLELTEYPMTKEDELMVKRFGDNHDYIFRNIGELREGYLNQYVAVYDKKVVGHGTDLQEIYDRLREKYPMKDYVTIVVEFVSERDEELAYGSGNCTTPYTQLAAPVA
jgi:CRISPR/Cas system-associated protein endoribonuclease Cas2